MNLDLILNVGMNDCVHVAELELGLMPQRKRVRWADEKDSYVAVMESNI